MMRNRYLSEHNWPDLSSRLCLVGCQTQTGESAAGPSSYDCPPPAWRAIPPPASWTPEPGSR